MRVKPGRKIPAAESKFRDLVDSAPGPVVLVGQKGRILLANAATGRLFGYSREELHGRPLSLLTSRPCRRVLAVYQRDFLTDPRAQFTAKGLELLGRKRNGAQFPIEINLKLLETDKGTLLWGAIRDVSERKRAERALCESEDRFQAIMDNSPAMIFLKDRQGRYLRFNRQFAEVFNLSWKRAAGKTDAEIFAPNQAAVSRANDLKVIEAGVPMVFDEVAVHADGPHTNIVTKFPLHDGDGKIYAIAGIITDVTERRRLEAEVLRISDREQQRIAQDLHDGLGQHLTGIVHLAAVLQAKLADRSLPEATEAARIVNLLDEAVAQTRTLARGLHPVQLEAGGLMSSLEQLAALVTDLFKIDCRFECPRPLSMPDNVLATHLYRIAQEAINNAIKHGRATQIRIDLRENSDTIALTVQNNGAVISKQRSPKEGLGLRIMQYRAEMIGGSLLIDSGGRRGATVLCKVPKRGALLEPSSSR